VDLVYSIRGVASQDGLLPALDGLIAGGIVIQKFNRDKGTKDASGAG